MNPVAPAAPVIPPRWDWHYRALLRLRAALLREHETRNLALREPRSDVEGDFIDEAVRHQEHDELLAELSLEEVELAEVDAALGRILDGTYGVCQVTGEAIPAARLRAVPWTRYTQRAAAGRERVHKNHSAPP